MRFSNSRAWLEESYFRSVLLRAMWRADLLELVFLLDRRLERRFVSGGSASLEKGIFGSRFPSGERQSNHPQLCLISLHDHH